MEHAENTDMRDLRANYLPLFPADRNARILDVGCGYGRVLAFLAQQGYQNIEGVDTDEKAVSWVESNVTPSVEVIDDLGKYLAHRVGRFDLVIARHVVYYFPRESTASYMEALRRSLRIGGSAIIEIFNGASLTGPYVGHKDPRINWILTEHSLRSLLEDAGFSDVTVAEVKVVTTGWRGLAFRLVSRLWQRTLSVIYVLERGIDEQNPTILAKSLLAVARRTNGS